MHLINYIFDWLRRCNIGIATTLPHVTTYTRELPISLTRMYENAIDGEHLPWLHSSSFAQLEIIDQGSWGWRATANLHPISFMTHMTLELRLDRDKNRWITKTISGLGKGTEVWTHAIPIDDNKIKIIVDFYVPKLPRLLKSTYAKYYLDTYAKLYDEDIWMMATRQHELDRIQQGKSIEPQDQINLGNINDIEKQLPLDFSFNNHPYRLLKLDDEWVVHSTSCPHMLGPLNQVANQQGTVECPWHGYQFDVRTRECTQGGKCKLAPPPALTVDKTQNNIIISR